MKKITFTISLFTLIFFIINITSAEELGDKLKGKILLQVEKNGEAWYVNPSNGKRYFMGTPSDAFSLMRELGIGISNSNLYKIPVGVISDGGSDGDNDGLPDNLENALGLNSNNSDTDGDGHSDGEELLNGYNPWGNGKQNIDNQFASNQSGKILLQVEKNGEAWYVNPSDKKRYFLGRPSDAFNLMRKFGLGITNENLDEIIKNTNYETGIRVRTDRGYQFALIKGWDSIFGYYSPQNIEFYEDYGHEPNNAPMRIFTLVAEDDPTLQPANYLTLEYDEYISDLEKAERNNPDSIIQVNDLEFKKYDLINYKEYNDKDYGNVIVLLSPEISNNTEYIRRIAIEWYEYPGGEIVVGNSMDSFNKIISTFESFLYNNSTVEWKDF